MNLDSPSDATGNPDPAGFGVYVHWPFCASKCPYCDFNSHVRHGRVDQKTYRDAYLREISTHAERLGGRTVGSIFFGGGTPSLMEPDTVAAIIDAIVSHWSLTSEAEITLEANPSSVETGRFRGYRSAGINRVSLGVQSLIDKDLEMLGRLHTAAEARGAIAVARDTFERFSFDLIYARPGQSAEAWAAELEDALALGAAHMSLYQLTIEAGTPFADLYNKGRLQIPPDAAAEEFFGLTQEITEAAGLRAYETSNHARPGQESRHNLVYWRYGEYAGIGPGAHGRLIIDGQRLATSAERLPETWLARVGETGTGVVSEEQLLQAEQADEMLLMGLRLTEGIDLRRLAKLGGVVPAPQAIGRLVTQGVIRFDPSTYRLVAIGAGRFVLNEIVLQLSASFEPSDTAESRLKYDWPA